MRTEFWHYTCSHAIEWIRADGCLVPHKSPLLPEPLVWLTDLEVPMRDALGLTSRILSCDRTEHRVRAVTDAAVWWPVYSRSLDPAVRRGLDFAPGAMPAHWWVCHTQVPVLDLAREAS